ncbi:MAG: stage III sporulation protein AF [Oscillospiraceae bacterium]|nr:stage III sporulation protein AF [Oscillospiraceae bacterium]
MSAVLSVCCAVCVVAIAGSVLSVLMPDGNTKKIITLVLGAFMLCSVILPIKSAVTGFTAESCEIPDEQKITASADEIYTNRILSQTEENLSNTLISLLKSEGINVKRVRFYLKQDENLGIIISKICIYIDKKDNTYVFRINEITEENFGQTPFVIAEK